MGFLDRFKSAANTNKGGEVYEVVKDDGAITFNKAIFGSKSPKVIAGDWLLCTGKEGNHPSFKIAFRVGEKTPPAGDITTSYKADGTPASCGLKHLTSAKEMGEALALRKS